MDGSTVAIILLVGGFVTIGCATAFVWMTADDERPGDSDALAIDDYMLGGEAFITVRPDRQPSTPPSADSELGLVAEGFGGGPLFQLGDDAFVFRNEGDAGLATPVVPRPRSRFRLVK